MVDDATPDELPSTAVATAVATRRVAWCAAVLAAALTVALTRDGVLLGLDSPTYLWTARWMSSDPTRLVHLPADTALSIRGSFPPLYPMVLAVAGWMGDDLVAGRFLGVLLAAVGAALLARLVARQTSPAVGLVAVALVFASRSCALLLFGFLMSDGLHVVLGVAAISVLVPTLRDSCDRVPLRIAGAFACAAAALGTRFVGIGLVGAVALIVAVLPRGVRHPRVVAVGGAVAAVTPMAIWQAAGGDGVGIAGFRPGWYPPLSAPLRAGDSLVAAFAPRQLLDALGHGGVRAVGLVLLVAAMIWTAGVLRSASRAGSAEPVRVTAVLLVVGWSHLATVIASRAFVDPFIEAEGRQTLLWLICLIAAVVIDVHRRFAPRGAAHPVRRTQAWAAARAVTVALLIAGSVLLARSVEDPGASWWNLGEERPSRVAAVVPEGWDLPVVYTNREDVLYLQAHRRTKALPLEHLRNAVDADPSFRSRVQAMGDAVRAGRADVVVFTDDPYWSVPIDVLNELTGLRVGRREADGVVLVAPS